MQPKFQRKCRYFIPTSLLHAQQKSMSHCCYCTEDYISNCNISGELFHLLQLFNFLNLCNEMLMIFLWDVSLPKGRSGKVLQQHLCKACYPVFVHLTCPGYRALRPFYALHNPSNPRLSLFFFSFFFLPQLFKHLILGGISYRSLAFREQDGLRIGALIC